MRAAGITGALLLLLILVCAATTASQGCEDCAPPTSPGPPSYTDEPSDGKTLPFTFTNKPQAPKRARLLVRLRADVDPVVKLASQQFKLTAKSVLGELTKSTPSPAQLLRVVRQLQGSTAGGWIHSSQFLPPTAKLASADNTTSSKASASDTANKLIHRWCYSTITRTAVVEAANEDDLDELMDYFQGKDAPPLELVTRDHVVKLRTTDVPNDAYFSRQWAAAKIGLINDGQRSGPGAWNVSTGDNNIVVAVIDSGAWYNHPDLRDNIWINPTELSNGQDDDKNGYTDDFIGWDFVSDDNDPIDDNGHGTHCAGIIGAVGNNAIGVSGVMQSVKLMILKFMNNAGEGSYSNIQRALEYAIVNRAHITSNSYGADQFDIVLRDMIRAAERQGQLFVTAAGNDKRNLDTSPSYPSSFAVNIILSVAATDQNDELATFSNYGAAMVDIAAPGTTILSTWPSERGITTSGNYREVSGTSMACPMVAGCAALLLATMRARNMPFERQGLFIKQVLMDSADRLPGLKDKLLTEGRVNVERAIAQLLGQPLPPAPPPSPPAPPPMPPAPPGPPNSGTVIVRTPPNPPGVFFPDEPGSLPPPPFRAVVPGAAVQVAAQSLLLALLGAFALLALLL